MGKPRSADCRMLGPGAYRRGCAPLDSRIFPVPVLLSRPFRALGLPRLCLLALMACWRFPPRRAGPRRRRLPRPSRPRHSQGWHRRAPHSPGSPGPPARPRPRTAPASGASSGNRARAGWSRRSRPAAEAPGAARGATTASAASRGIPLSPVSWAIVPCAAAKAGSRPGAASAVLIAWPERRLVARAIPSAEAARRPGARKAGTLAARRKRRPRAARGATALRMRTV